MNEPLRLRAADLIRSYAERGWMIATAESCTGGLVAALLTEIAGSSAVVERGFVTYSNAAKSETLGVAADLIAVDRGPDMPVQGQPELLGGRTDGGGPDPPRPTDAALGGQHAVALDNDRGRWSGTRRADC